jgi:hypothetical protein
LAGLIILGLWTVLMAYLYSIGVFSDDPSTGGDDVASGAAERGIYLLVWLIVAVPIAVATLRARR